MNFISTIRSLQSIENEDTRFFKTQQFMLKKETRDRLDRRVVAVLAMAINPSMLDLQSPSDFLMRQEADIFLSEFLTNPNTSSEHICQAFDVWKQQDVEETKKYVQDRMIFCYLNNLDNAYFCKTLENMNQDTTFLDALSFAPVSSYDNEWDAVLTHLAPHPLVQRYAQWREGKLDVLDFLQKLHRSHESSIERLLQLS